MAVTSESTTLWTGTLKEGSGTTRLDSSKVAEFPVNWTARSVGQAGTTNPEELLGAAHSACFSMALANILTSAGHPPESIQTTAAVTFEAGKGAARQPPARERTGPRHHRVRVRGVRRGCEGQLPDLESTHGHPHHDRSRARVAVRVLIAGASGFIGTDLTARLVEEGHDVLRLVRRRAHSPEEVSWSPAAGIIDFTVMDRVDAVVNLSGAPLAHLPWTKRYKAEILDSRIAATRTLTDAMRKAKRAARGVPQRIGRGDLRRPPG